MCVMFMCVSVVVVASSILCVDFLFFFKQKTAYEVRISDWSSDVCSSDLPPALGLIEPSLEMGMGTFDRSVLVRLAAVVAGSKHAVMTTQQIGRASCRARVCQYV